MGRAKPPINGYADIERTCPICDRKFIAAAFHQSVVRFKDANGIPRRVFLCRESCYERYERERTGR